MVFHRALFSDHFCSFCISTIYLSASAVFLDSKIVSVIKDMMSSADLQPCINAVTEWTKKWLVKLNSKKCVVMHLGNSNPRHKYTIEDCCDINSSRDTLKESSFERDLGVHISSDLKWKKHIDEIVSKANRVLGMLVKTFICKDIDLWRNLYVSLVRPHLEYASVIWNPYYKGDINALEKVQRRASKIPLDMRHKPYEERLKIWNLTSLEERRTRGDRYLSKFGLF